MQSAMICVQKIKNAVSLRDALKHNLRQIPQETRIESHIDPTRSKRNLVLSGENNPVTITREVVERVKQETGKPLRKNGVLAIEVIVSLPVNVAFETEGFFRDSLDWLEEYWGCPIVSAVVHHDEANPHMHVLVLPLRHGRMAGGKLVGYKPDLANLKKSHHSTVGCHYGLSLVVGVPRFKRLAAAKEILACLEANPTLVLSPSIRDAMLGAFAARPAELMSVLGIAATYG